MKRQTVIDDDPIFPEHRRILARRRRARHTLIGTCVGVAFWSLIAVAVWLLMRG